MITSTMKPTYTGTYFLGELGERGNSQQIQGFQPFPLIECMGNRGNTNMFLNIRLRFLLGIWLSLFPRNFRGEQKPPSKPPETLAVPTVPPFPRFIFTDTFGMYGNPGELAQ